MRSKPCVWSLLVALLLAIPLNLAGQSSAAADLPVLFAHGFCSDSSVWETFRAAVQPSDRYGNGITRLYYDTGVVRHKDTGHKSVEDFEVVDSSKKLFTIDFYNAGEQSFQGTFVNDLSITYKAVELREVIGEIRRITGAPQVIVVGHSLGGLVARAYVQGFASLAGFDQPTLSYNLDVARVIQLDSPNRGLSLANWPKIKYSPAKVSCYAEGSVNRDELRPEGNKYSALTHLNDGSKPLPTGLDVFSITSFQPEGLAFTGQRAASDPAEGDGVVPYDSQNIKTLYPSHPTVTNVDNPIVQPLEFHTRVHSLPETVALLKDYTANVRTVLPQLRTHLDAPAGRISQAVVGEGWAYVCRGTVATLGLVIDGSPVSATFQQKARKDVVKVFRPECPTLQADVGFTFMFDPSYLKISNGKHSLRVVATDSFGQTDSTNQLTVEVDLPQRSLIPSLTSITTSTPTLPGQRFTFTLVGKNIDAKKVEVVFSGPGCAPCAVTNRALQTNNNTVTGAVVLNQPGSYTVSVRNGVSEPPSGALSFHVGPFLTNVALAPSRPLAKRQFTFSITGGNFDAAVVEILFMGPGCSPCIVRNDALLAKSAQLISGPATLDTAGTYRVHVRNGSLGASSNGLDLAIGDSSPPAELTFDSPLVLFSGAGSVRIETRAAELYAVAAGSSTLPSSVFGVRLRRSLDAGTSWTAPVSISRSARNTGDPAIVVRDNSVFVAWVEYPDTSTFFGEIWFARSIDAGATFEPPLRLSTSGVVGRLPVMVYVAGTVIVAWDTTSAAAIPGIGINRSPNGGSSFGLPQLLPTTGGGVKMRADDTTVYVAWSDGQLRFTRSSNAGQTFEPARVVGAGNSLEDLVVDGDNLFILSTAQVDHHQTVVLTRSSDRGTSFFESQNVSQTPGRTAGGPRLHVSGESAYLTWSEDSVGNDQREDLHAMVRTSHDRGGSFLSPVDASRAVPLGAFSIIVVPTSEGTHVAWLTASSSRIAYDVTVATSLDGAETFGTPQNVSHHGFVLGFDAKSIGNVVTVAWTTADGVVVFARSR